MREFVTCCWHRVWNFLWQATMLLTTLTVEMTLTLSYLLTHLETVFIIRKSSAFLCNFVLFPCSKSVCWGLLYAQVCLQSTRHLHILMELSSFCPLCNCHDWILWSISSVFYSFKENVTINFPDRSAVQCFHGRGLLFCFSRIQKTQHSSSLWQTKSKWSLVVIGVFSALLFSDS